MRVPSAGVDGAHRRADPLHQPALPREAEAAEHAAAGSSRLPATRLTASSRYVVSVPFSPVQVPNRPYTAARGVRARSRASDRTVSGSMPVRCW